MYERFSPIYQFERQTAHKTINEYEAGSIFFLMRPALSGSDDKCTRCWTLIIPTPILEEYDKNVKKAENIFLNHLCPNNIVMTLEVIRIVRKEVCCVIK